MSLLLLFFAEQLLQGIEAFVPEYFVKAEPLLCSPERGTLMCLETAAKDIGSGSASSLTVHSPDANRAIMARRDGSASA
jgi:hypothetical protein